MAYSKYRDNLFDRPSVVDADFCAICGRPASNAHHVIQKGMGGVSKETDKRIPRIRLCGSGNASGCHGLVHQGKLHLNWDDCLGGWVFFMTPDPVSDELCWELHSDAYLPVPGWVEQQEPTIVYGRGKA